jgi:hypothetical protein
MMHDMCALPLPCGLLGLLRWMVLTQMLQRGAFFEPALLSATTVPAHQQAAHTRASTEHLLLL